MNSQELIFWQQVYIAALSSAAAKDKTIFINQYAEAAANQAISDMRKAMAVEEVDTGI